MYLHVTFTKLLFILISVALLSLNGCALFNSNDGQAAPVDDSPYNDPNNDNYSSYPSPNMDTSTYHTVQPGETLYGIATRYGRNYQDVAAWNSIPPPYMISVGQHLLISAPAGGTVAYPTPSVPATPVYTPPAPRVGTPSYHTVQQGESLYGISTRYGQNFRDVAAWNNIPPPYSLSIGQQLLVSSPTGAVYQPPVSSAPVYNPAPTYNPPSGSTSYHTVSPGDTLYSIAKRYGRTVGEVAAWNNLSPPYTLSVGMRLIVSSSQGVSSYSTYSTYSTFSAPSGGGYHTVSPGENVYRIAKMYGCTIGQIAAWNSLYPPYILQVGQRLRVSSNGVEAPSFKAQSVASTASTSTSLNHHVVQQGENLQVVANKYGVTTHELISWNGIGTPYTIFPQQELLVAPPN